MMRGALVLAVVTVGCATPDKYIPGPDGSPGIGTDAGAPAVDQGSPAGSPEVSVDGTAPDSPVPFDSPADLAVDAAQAGPVDLMPDRPALVPDLPPAVCAVEERKCNGDTTMKCRADRSGFETEEVCGGRTPYCFDGQCTGCGGGKGVCADGLCPANCPNETPTACYGDCGPVPEGEVRIGGTGIIARNNLWGECGPYQALVGGVVDPSKGIICSFDRAEYAHRSADCRAVDYAEDPATPNEFVSTCRDDELVAGLGKAGPSQYLCCKANVGHKACQRQSSCRVDQYAADVIASEQVAGAVLLWCCSP